MVHHLDKVHGIHLKPQGEAIAMKWKHTVEKKAWSCGFCINVFTTFNHRLSHIATQHFESGQTMEEWDVTKVIQGLLQQSGMTEAWKNKLASLPDWEVPDIVWEKDGIRHLQHGLEVGPKDGKSAVDLAESAYIACRLNWGMENQQALACPVAEPDGQSDTALLSQNHFQAMITSASNFDSSFDQPQATVQQLSEVLSSVEPTRATSLEDHRNAPMAGSSSSNIIGPALSPSYSQQTQSVTGHQGNDNSLYGDHGNDMEESQPWPKTPGSTHEKGVDMWFTRNGVKN